MVFFRFYSNFNRTLCKQIVESLIRRRVLIWFSTVCRYSIKRTLGLHGLTNVRHFRRGHFDQGRFDPDILATDTSATEKKPNAKTINCGLGCVHAFPIIQ